MAHRRPRGRGISEAQRRKKTWVQLKSEVNAAGGNESQFQTSFMIGVPASIGAVGGTEKTAFAAISDPAVPVGLGDEVSTLPEESTILRMRGSLVFPPHVTAVANIPSQYAIGYGVTDIRSIVGGAFPGPIIDADWDGWMFLRQSGVGPLDAFGSEVDVKAMRKLQGGDTFFVAVESVAGTGAGADAAEWNFDLRLLLLLP